MNDTRSSRGGTNGTFARPVSRRTGPTERSGRDGPNGPLSRRGLRFFIDFAFADIAPPCCASRQRVEHFARECSQVLYLTVLHLQRPIRIGEQSPTNRDHVEVLTLKAPHEPADLGR